MFFSLSIVLLCSRLAWALPAANKRAACSCGYKDSSGALWRESIEADFTRDYNGALSNFGVQTWGTQPSDSSYYMQYTAANVYPYNDGLGMKTSGYDGSGTIRTAEIDSVRNDILYGSFRIRATVPSVPGVCFGFFTYRSDSQEADIEFLSSDPNYYQTVHYTNQPGQTSGATQTVTVSGADFTAFNEHRFDWNPDATTFYVNGAQKSSISVNVPNQPSNLIVNNWSSGSAGWTHGPPTSDAVASIQYINAYFNSSAFTASDFDAACNSAGAVEACSI